MNLKPTDFFMGLQDFFTILVPGAIIVIFLYFNQSELIGKIFNKLLEDSSPFHYTVLIFYSYVLGHVVKRIGGYLDKIYDRFFSQSHSSKLLEEIKEIKDQKYSNISNYEYARFRLLDSKTSFASEVDADMISSKFFRSLVVCIAFILIYYCVAKNYLIIICLICLLIFSFLQYVYLRKKSVDKTYKYAIFDLHNAR